MEAKVRRTAERILGKGGLKDDERAEHKEAFFLHVTMEGDLVREDRLPSESTCGEAEMRNMWVLPTSATVEFQDSKWVGFLTFLLSKEGWTLISAVYSSGSPDKILPMHMSGALEMCWDGYCGANRACDGIRMAQVFHPLCRLTYADEEGNIAIIGSEAFCKELVAKRYESDPHREYTAFKDTPEASKRDTLLGVALASPLLGLVRLRVGHPPFLWTDLLVCARFKGAWWIVAKSSSGERFHIE